MKTLTRWRPPLLWRAALQLARGVTGAVSRLEVTGRVPGESGHGIIVAVNHIGNFDPIAITAACAKVGVAPRFLAMEELFGVPVVGSLMRHAGHIRVDRDKPTATDALTEAQVALDAGSVVIVYPEGRIGRDPGLWPERGKTGTGRLALATGARIVPAAIWGAHEVLPYSSPKGMWGGIWRSLRHRPVVKVHFGDPIDVSDVDPTRPGAAQRVTDRMMDSIIEVLAPLRADEPEQPRYRDPTKVSETRRTHRRKAVS